MKKALFISLVALAVGTVAAFAVDTPVKTADKAAAAEAECPMHKKAGAKKCSCKMCPEKMAGVAAVSRNTPDGVEITLTAKNKENTAKLQELARAHFTDKEAMCADGPGRVEGAETKFENTADGAKVLITGKTPDVIKKIQEVSAKEHMKAGPGQKEGTKEAKTSKKYVCPMGCAQSDKPGKCPKCGMQMTEKK